MKIINLFMLFAAMQSCTCADESESYPAGPPDTSCSQDNPLAEPDETIPELCDHIDNNCDGQIDEDCDCFSNEPIECWNDNYPLEFHTQHGFGRLHGECEYGRQICRKFDEGGSQWGAWNDGPDQIGGTPDDVWVANGCDGIVLPATELCDGRDNNCDGRVDESLKKSCWSGPREPDGTPMDYIVFNDPVDNSFVPCKLGIQTCEAGRWTGCLYEVLPEQEKCNGLDDNCNGIVDEAALGVGAQCGRTDDGICEYGAYVCKGDSSGNADLECVGASLPEVEVCNNNDDDCDGDIDENLIKPCESVCGSGVEVCAAGSWTNCSAQRPENEACDGLDNDCDGEVDEDLDCGCPPGMVGSLIACKSDPLQCGLGYMECICETEECLSTVFSECQALCVYRPEIQEECNPELGFPSEELCNNWDDDCDTEVDEELFQPCYSGPPATLDIGICAEGRQACKQGRWGGQVDDVFIDDVCIGQILPIEETCNGIDDDCDGDIDEDLDRRDKVDMTFIIDRSRSMCGTISALRRGIEPYVLDFIGTEHRFAIVNVPGSEGVWRNGPPNLMTNFVDAATFQALLNNVGCDHYNVEPQYDAVFRVATNMLNLSFRADAYPMMVVITDEIAQSLENITPVELRQALSPCQVGDCGNGNVFKTYAIVPERFNNEWCAPAGISLECYDLYPGITSETVQTYLEDIFSEVCR